MAYTNSGSSIAIDAQAFTGNLSAIVALTSGKRWMISGWDLTMTENSTMANCQIVLGSTIKAATRFSIHTGASGQPLNRWTVLGVSISGAIGDALNINGGGTAGVLNGVIFCQQV